MMFDQNPHLVELLLSVVHYWLSHPQLKQELFIVQSLIEFLDLMVYSERFWVTFKGSKALNIFIQTQLRQDLSAITKSKVLRII